MIRLVQKNLHLAYLRFFFNGSAISVVNLISVDPSGLCFDSRAGRVGHSVANGSPPLRRFFGAVLPWN